ncbi:uncharacterized protein [Littorina saxatilis]
MHTVAFFPLQEGEYPPVLFVGGLDGLIPAEMYMDVQTLLASHGFVVFGVDIKFPLLQYDVSERDVGDDVKSLFNQLDWLRGYMENRTEARIAWNSTVLACHSAGCDATLKMIQQNHTVAKASVFLEPFSNVATEQVDVKIPVLSYGTQLSEEGFPQCAVAGKDWKQFYNIFSCPRVLMEAKGFGHCDILDPIPWQACHDIHFCTTTNNTRNADYRKFVQGAMSAFLAGTLEGDTDALTYILNTTRVPVDLLDLRHDLEC